MLTHRQRWTLALTSLGSFVVVLDFLVVSTALTAIRDDLHASIGDLEWTVNAYTLTFAVLLMSAAVLGDRLGRRRVYAAGLGLFAIASAGCALAPGIGVLVAARAVQGVGAAIVMPLALGLLNSGFPPERRGWAMGMYGSVTGMGAVLGPIVGGAVTQGLAWQWIFWINVPIGLLAIPFVLTKLDETAVVRRRLDPVGVVLCSAAALGLVWGLVRTDSVGWGDAQVVAPLTLGAACVLAFALWERRFDSPMIPPRLFGSREFTAGGVAIFCLNGSLSGAVFFTAQFLQAGLHHDPLAAGLRLLPWGVVPFVVAPFTGRLADRLGGRPLVVAGIALWAVGMLWLGIVASTTVSYWELCIPMVISGFGFSVAIPAVTRSVVGMVATADVGTASGAYTTMRQLGGAFGIAILSAFFTGDGGFTSISPAYSAVLFAAAGVAFVGVISAVLMREPLSRRAGRRADRRATAGVA
jgi:EmrB/QacA subfamily drug resistance transporter